MELGKIPSNCQFLQPKKINVESGQLSYQVHAVETEEFRTYKPLQKLQHL